MCKTRLLVKPIFYSTKFYFFYATRLSVEVAVINDGNSLRYVRFQNIEIRMTISKLCSNAQDKMRIYTCLLDIYPFAKKKYLNVPFHFVAQYRICCLLSLFLSWAVVLPSQECKKNTKSAKLINDKKQTSNRLLLT